MEFIKRLLSGSNEAEVKKLSGTAGRIEAVLPTLSSLSDDQLRAKTREFRDRLLDGATLDDILPEAFAVVSEAASRTIGQRPFRVQNLGAIILHQGRIAEMKTGEGKTLTAALASYLNALPGHGVHVVTVNEYLAKFQSEWMAKIHRCLGLTVGLILHDREPHERRAAYACDITYATNNELGFDYLRDNMAIYRENMVQRELNFAIVDEVDSILIDEARTPLIISGHGEKSTAMYGFADAFVHKLREAHEYENEPERNTPGDFVRDEKKKTINLTEQGTKKAEAHFGVENLSDVANTELHHHILAALRANFAMKRDVDYVVKDGQVIIVDEFTGRLMVGRRYSEGLHQAIEAKERVKVERESKTLATITFQNYFRMYSKLSGMTGTAKTEEDEFRGIYKLDVVQAPTNKPMIRRDLNDAVYRSVNGKFNAVVEEVVKRHATGQPVLVGTVSVEKSEILSAMLARRGIKHEVLNAKNHAKEAEIVAQAGKREQVTIATNMAGRGTDILLGGNPEFLARQEMQRAGYSDDIIDEATGHAGDAPAEVLAARNAYNGLVAKHAVNTSSGHDDVVKLGGLHILGTERHESRRIDNQLRGRAGRQGDPGSSQFFISLEDDLMRLFGSDRIAGMVAKLGLEEDQSIEFGILSKQIEGAQKRVESRNFDIRKSVLQYDDVMNQQRETIYGQRKKVLSGEDAHDSVMDMLDQIVQSAVDQYCHDKSDPENWDIAGLKQYFGLTCLPVERVPKDISSRDDLIKELHKRTRAYYDEREKQIEDLGFSMREFERVALLGAVDSRWMDHIDAMDQLRDGIGLRAYGQRDPIVEYKIEGFAMFEEMIRLIQEDTLRRLAMAQLKKAPEREKVAEETAAQGADDGSLQKRPVVKNASGKVGRNDPCPCGSGKKYKNCCGKLAE